MTMVSISAARSFLHPLIGQPIWGVTRSHGSAFLAEFGAVREIVTLPARQFVSGIAVPEREVPRGTGGLMVELCRWRIQVGEQMTSDLDEDHPRMQRGMSALEGANVLAIHLDAKALTFHFSNGGQMKLGPAAYAAPSDKGTQWVVFLPGGGKLSRAIRGALIHE